MIARPSFHSVLLLFLRVEIETSVSMNKTCCPTKRSFPLQGQWLSWQQCLRNTAEIMRHSWTQGENLEEGIELITKDWGKSTGEFLVRQTQGSEMRRCFKRSGCQEGVKKTFWSILQHGESAVIPLTSVQFISSQTQKTPNVHDTLLQLWGDE